MKILLVDYENVQSIQIDELDPNNTEIVIFIGDSQNKIPFQLVKDSQKFGEKLNWIKIEGNGTNALDFHIAYHLGKITNEKTQDKYIILSKDKGFDPLVKYICKQGFECKRINSINEIIDKRKNKTDIDKYKKLFENLKKIGKTKRPRKRSTLITHAKSGLGNILEEQLNDIIDELFINNEITEENGKIKYHF